MNENSSEEREPAKWSPLAIAIYSRLLIVLLGMIPVFLTTPVIYAVTEWPKGMSLCVSLAFFFGVPLFIQYGIGRWSAPLADKLFTWFVGFCLVVCLAMVVIGAILPAFVKSD